jgi:hypothetical protein
MERSSMLMDWQNQHSKNGYTTIFNWERAGNTLEAISIGKDFLSRTQVAQQLRERMDK